MSAKSLDSLTQSTTMPYELIVNDDGSTQEVKDMLFGLLQQGKLSKLSLQNGENRGIKHASLRACDQAEGDYIYKLDTDLIYKPNWLETTNSILDKNDDVGAVGLFNYRNYAPDDERFDILEERDDCFIVNDFVSSGIGMRRETYLEYRPSFQADGWQLEIAINCKIAIPKQDVATNIGFGIGPSTYVIEKDGVIQTTPFHDKPYIIDNKVIVH